MLSILYILVYRRTDHASNPKTVDKMMRSDLCKHCEHPATNCNAIILYYKLFSVVLDHGLLKGNES